MSQISDFYDALVTKLATVLPDHTRLPTPEKPEENPDPHIRKSQNFYIASDTNNNLNISCKFSSEIEVVIVLTRKIYAKELDVSGIDDAKKALLEDFYNVRSSIENDPTLGNSAAITKFDFVSHAGVQFLFLNKDSFIKIEATYSLVLVDEF